MPNIGSLITNYGAAASAVLILLALVGMWVARHSIEFIYRHWPGGRIKNIRDSVKQREGSLHSLSPHSHNLAREHLVRVLNEGADELANAIITAKIYAAFDTAATIAQAIISGVMLTAYARSSIKPESVLWWGVLVFIASQAKRVFTPEARAARAQKKADALKAMLLYFQSRLNALDVRSTKGEDRTDALLSLMYQSATALSGILYPDLTLETPDQKSGNTSAIIEASASSRLSQTPSDDTVPAIAATSTSITSEDPRLLIEIAPLAKEGDGFKSAVGIRLRNVGGSEMLAIKLDDLILTKHTIEFPSNIPALAAGALSHVIAGRVKEAGPMFMDDIVTAMMDEWNYQPQKFAEIVPIPGSATYKNFKGESFRAQWTFELYPFKYMAWKDRIQKHTEVWLPDNLGPSLAVSEVKAEKVIESAVVNSNSPLAANGTQER